MVPLAKNTITSRCLELRKLHRESIFHFQQIGIRRIPVSFELFENEWEFSFSKISHQEKDRLQIYVDWGGARCLLRMSISSVEDLVCRAIGVDRIIGSNPLSNMLMFDTGFSQFADLIEISTRKRFIFLSSDLGVKPDWAKHGLLVTLSSESLRTDIEFWFDEIGLGFFSVAVRGLEKFPSTSEFIDELPLRLVFLAGRTRLSCGQLRGIDKHDVIFLDECFISDENVIRIHILDSYSCKAKISGSYVEIIDELKKEFMNDIVDIRQDDEYEALDDLEFRIEFDLGERSITLSELKSIVPGYVFDLGRDLRKSVTIRANGKIIGTGELVDIDGFTGVSVLSFIQKF